MPGGVSGDDAMAAVHVAWRAESARLVGALMRVTGDLALAEDVAQDALVAAFEQWPTSGVPDKPGAWLMGVAKRRAVDQFRRADTLRRKVAEIQHAHSEEVSEMPEVDFEPIEDDSLRLMFLCCHPSLSADSRAALTLRLVGGLTTGEIARGFLTTEATMGQRISRAKKTLAQARAEFDLPTGAERAARLNDVMAVIYLIFNEGYSATEGADWMRLDLVGEAVRLARLLSTVAPDDLDVLSLQALVELQASRMQARVGQGGEPVLLEQQDRCRWDAALISSGLDALARAERQAAAGTAVGSYFLQASIAAQHAVAPRAHDTDWPRIAALYDALAQAAPGPVVEVNRAVAHGRAFSAQAGLVVLDAIGPGALGGSPLVPSVRGDLLERAGQFSLAASSFRQAAACTQNERERALFEARAQENRDRARSGS